MYVCMSFGDTISLGVADTVINETQNGAISTTRLSLGVQTIIFHLCG